MGERGIELEVEPDGIENLELFIHESLLEYVFYLLKWPQSANGGLSVDIVVFDEVIVASFKLVVNLGCEAEAESCHNKSIILFK